MNPALYLNNTNYPMTELILKHFQYEISDWKKSLEYMSEENILQKDSLSEILKNQFDSSLLEEIEIFHNHFLEEDEQIAQLQSEVKAVDNLLIRELIEDRQFVKQVDVKIKNIRKKIKWAERDLSKLKMSFKKYLAENIMQKR